MDLYNLTILPELKVQDININLNNNIKTIRIYDFQNEKDVINIISFNELNNLEDIKGNYLIYNHNSQKINSNKGNYIYTDLTNKNVIFSILNKAIYDYNNFIISIYEIITKDKGINELLRSIKKQFNSNVCVLNSNKKLLYNIFDFKKVNNTYPLKVKRSTTSRVYGYLAFENINNFYSDEINRILDISNNYIYDNLSQLMVSKDNFYNTLKNLSNNTFNEEDAKNLDILNWKINDSYKVYFVQIDGGLFKYRDMFIHGNRFILDHPMYLYSLIHNNYLMLVINESHVNINKIRSEIEVYLDKYNLKRVFLNLGRNLLDFYKAYELATYIINYNLEYTDNLEEYLPDLIFNMCVSNNFIDLLIPNELKTVMDHDKNKKTELLKTLYFYLIEERSLIKASKQLDVHRNSIVYRINKLNELVDLDLEDSKSRYNILIALELLNKLNPGLIK
ncbi:helix-turn-helix domain-containing protein [Miniphocaeibacter massiliensis]|uniref:helix-turn-helix domain-containing protein n=1 Tax=Miniphocaeibacter massiliensis TaxID=2041841 RepID=UPI000C079DD9|nr:helix-turn-helix domain-containing protein [Miniphocaeibacter massiliensis]